MPNKHQDVAVTAVNCADLRNEAGAEVSFVFHGMFGFLISEDQDTIEVSAPIVNDHVCAVRLSIPQSDPAGDTLPFTAPVPVPQGGLTIDLVQEELSKAVLQTNTIVRLKRRKGEPWKVPNANSNPPYLSFSVPYPNCISAYRTSTKSIGAGFTGADVSPEDTDPNVPKPYAIVHRFTYRAAPSQLKVNLTYSFGTINLMEGLSPMQVIVHFYAQELFDDGHDPADALKSLREIYDPVPDVALTGLLVGPVNATTDEAGLFAADEDDLRDVLTITDFPVVGGLGAKLRNCIALYLDNSVTQS